MGEVLDFQKFREERAALFLAEQTRMELFRIYGFLETRPDLGFCGFCEQVRGFDGRCKNKNCPSTLGPPEEST